MGKDTKGFLSIVVFMVSVLCVFSACNSNSGGEVYQTIFWGEKPEYEAALLNPKDADFTLSSIDFAKKMNNGWNLGNTLDAYCDGVTGVDTETCWGQPKATIKMMEGLKNSGITTIRIPTTWYNHMDTNFTVDSAWMARVKEVVDYAIDSGLYVILNSHHDVVKANGYYPEATYEEQSLVFIARLWEQIGLQFRNYDEHLIFETINEPRLKGTSYEWAWNSTDSNYKNAQNIINEMNQAAVSAIRKTNGNNINRYIMCPAYAATSEAARSSLFTLPTDTAQDKVLVSIHAYSPYDFAMQAPGDAEYTDGDEGSAINYLMSQLDTSFIKKNIGVVIGEYGATNKNNLADRVAFFTTYVSKAHEYSICPILWDNGNYQVPSNGSFSELYGFYNREEQTWYFPEILEAIVDN
jgi:endoglucanase